MVHLSANKFSKKAKKRQELITKGSKNIHKEVATPVIHALKGTEKRNFLLVRTLGNFLLLFSIYGVFATFGPAASYEVSYRIAKTRGVVYAIGDSKDNTSNTVIKGNETITRSFTDVLSGTQEQILTPPDTQFSIVIPKIGASSRVFPNIDPNAEDEFIPVLKNGVAHAKGTVFPGMPGNTYLFAHSTDNFWNVGRYNAVFYLLKELQPDDDITIFFENRRYNYNVQETRILDATDVDYLVNSQDKGSQKLILQTCWPPGTTWKRLYVIATPT